MSVFFLFVFILIILHIDIYSFRLLRLCCLLFLEFLALLVQWPSHFLVFIRWGCTYIDAVESSTSNGHAAIWSTYLGIGREGIERWFRRRINDGDSTVTSYRHSTRVVESSNYLSRSTDVQPSWLNQVHRVFLLLISSVLLSWLAALQWVSMIAHPGKWNHNAFRSIDFETKGSMDNVVRTIKSGLVERKLFRWN